MAKSFITQEIGSIQRPIWRQELNAKANPAWIKDALSWGQRLGVENEIVEELETLLSKDGKERSGEEKKRIVDISSIFVIRMQEKAGLDRVFNGEQPRTEMYDMLARKIPNIEKAGFVNSFDANYFRKGILAGELELEKDAVQWFVEEFDFVKKNTGRIVKPCITGAYTMTDWSYVEFFQKKHEKAGKSRTEAYMAGRREAILAFAEHVIRPVVDALVEAGAEVVQIDEPAAATNEQESRVFTESINSSFANAPKSVEKAVHLCYSNYSVLFPELSESVADSYQIEFTNHASPGKFGAKSVNPEAFKAIELFKQYKMPISVGVGVVDIHSDVIESPQLVKDRVLLASELLGGPEKVQVNPDCGLRTRTWEVAFKKLQNMVEGTALAKKELGI
ncbi:MAG: hypothetical protein HY394_04660 [Candidatus Diapherotrites archaeon]|nr:hypothetical protein [Candidatus Diapherotrites archaeon]